MLLYIKICPAVTLPAFITATMACKAICDDGIRQRLKVTSVYSESAGLGLKYSTQAVGRATNPSSPSIQHVYVDHCRTNISVP